MLKTVVFLGGVHGSGKTTLCSHLQSWHPLVAKQRYALWDVASKEGWSTWPDVARRHHDLITVAAEGLSERFVVHPSDLLLIDCHYAIRSDKALRHLGCDIATEHVADLDPRFVEELARRFRIIFILLDCSEVVARERLRNRPQELQDYSCSIEGLQKLAVAERELFLQMHFWFRTSQAVVWPAEESTTNHERALVKVLGW